MVQFDSPFPKTRKSLRKVLSLRIMMKALLIALAIFGVLFIFVLVGLIGLLGTEKVDASGSRKGDFDG